ncbi:hypothetical protein BIW11_07813, partial [Tropilaelaps mercedesae]
VIYSCYFFFNRPHAGFTAYLDLLGQDIDRRTCQRKIIITGDFNASAREWGASQTDVIGRELNEWLAQRNMVIINRGHNSDLPEKSDPDSIYICYSGNSGSSTAHSKMAGPRNSATTAT